MGELNYSKESVPSLIQDPFSKNHIIAIHMHMMEKIVGGGFSFIGTVEFRNNNTKGSQEFREKSFDDLYLAMSKFVKSL